MKWTGTLGALSLLLHVAHTNPLLPRWTLPTVDLGYEIHQAIAHDEALGYYNFSNIPFAAPPIGHLRFKAPRPPLRRNRKIPNKGDQPKICPQATTGWNAVTANFFFAYAQLLATGQTSRLDAVPVLNRSQVSIFNYKPKVGESEDCLYLDVLVPDAIYNAGKNSKAPVLVEIYGGGYINGDKVSVSESEGSARGLIQRGNSSFIYVALNYRLGAFGFLAGSEFESEGGNSNAGLLDQRAALKWIQKHIHQFGGDPAQVTVIGESAGAGSIEHQITAYGGKRGKAPFNRAISQSPGFVPIRWNSYLDTTYQAFLGYANATSLADLKCKPTLELMLANARQIFNTEAVGTFTYGPVVDGHFVPDLPGVLFANGSFDTSVHILAGQNRREGYLFTDPTLRDDAAIIGQLMKSLGTSQEAAEYVVTTLYPPLYNGSLGYTNWYERVATITTEFAFICNEYYMLSATAQQSNGYLFNYFPGFHGQDIPYTFFNGVVNASNPLEAQNANAAHTLQDWIVSFATGKTPQTHVPGSPNLPLYDGNHQIGALSGAQGLFMAGVVPDPANNLRCQWWQKGLFAHDPAAAF